METNPTPQTGCWLMIEEPLTETSTETTQTADKALFHDAYDYFPDFGI